MPVYPGSWALPKRIATQDPALRARFSGRPEYVINYFRLVADDVRRHMSRLGVRRLADLVGRIDLLETNKAIGTGKPTALI